MRRKSAVMHYWQEFKLVWKCPRNLKIDIVYDPVFLIQGIYPNEMKSAHERVTCVFMFIAAQFTITRTWNQLRCLQRLSVCVLCVSTVRYYSDTKDCEFCLLQQNDATGSHYAWWNKPVSKRQMYVTSDVWQLILNTKNKNKTDIPWHNYCF